MFFLLLLILFRTWNLNPCYSNLHFSASFNDIVVWYDIEYRRAFTSKSFTNIPLNAKGRQGKNSEHLLIEEFGFCGPKSIQTFKAVFCHCFLYLNLSLISFYWNQENISHSAILLWNAGHLLIKEFGGAKSIATHSSVVWPNFSKSILFT